MTNFPTIYRVIIGLRNLRDALRKKSNRPPPLFCSVDALCAPFHYFRYRARMDQIFESATHCSLRSGLREGKEEKNERRR